MTAIAGLWRFDGRPNAAEGCARMLGSLQMYGRDGLGSWSGGDIALGRRLARLLPEDIYDRQPLQGRGGIVLVADVRLDNRDELADALNLPGEQVRSMSDAAMLLAAYERWEADCFDRLLGDYAFALWDGERRRLTLARDALGMRPLFYHRGANFFAFATMPKGLHALPDVPYAPDEERMAEFLALMPDPGSPTFFAGIEKMEAGSYAVVTPDGMQRFRHWEPKRETLRLASPEAYAEGLREEFERAVRSRLRGVTEVGAHLSSGYDSSAVATTAARLLAPSGGRVHAFTAVPREGFGGPISRGRLVDEGPIAAETASLYPNMEHVLIRTGGRSPLANLDRNFLLYDQPVLNLCNAVWVDAIHDAARERKLGVILAANMGNMTISYTGEELLPELLSRGQLLRWAKEARALVPGAMRWRRVLLKSFGPWLPVPLWRGLHRLYGFVEHDLVLDTALRPERVRDLNLLEKARARHHDTAYRPWKDGHAMRLWVIRRGGLRGANQKGILAGWRLDYRDPTADRRLLEYCLSVPADQFLRNGRTRALARRAFSDRVPASVLNSRVKGYQAADWHEGLATARESLAEEIDRLDGCAPAVRAIATDRMRKLLKDWPADGWGDDAVVRAYRHALLRGISGGHFLRRVEGTNISTDGISGAA